MSNPASSSTPPDQSISDLSAVATDRIGSPSEPPDPPTTVSSTQLNHFPHTGHDGLTRPHTLGQDNAHSSRVPDHQETLAPLTGICRWLRRQLRTGRRLRRGRRRRGRQHRTRPDTRCKRRLTILQLNCNSLTTRLPELKRRLSLERPDVVLLQETLLKEGRATPKIPNYNSTARRDASMDISVTTDDNDSILRARGGILTFIRDDLPFTTIEVPYHPQMPDPYTYCTAIRIHPPGEQPIDVVNMYIHPSRWTSGPDSREESFQPDYLRVGPRTIIGGDMNAHTREPGMCSREKTP